MHFLNVKEFLDDIDDPVRKSNAETVFKNFEECVVPKLASFEKTVIHGDFNGQNIILNKKLPTDTYHVAGVIDWSDSCKSCTIFDLGICLAYLMVENLKPVHCCSVVEFVGPLIGGYHRILPLSADEFDSLYHLVLARCVQSAVMGTHNFKAEPWNTYLLLTPEKAWSLVEILLDARKEKVDTIWKSYANSSL